MGRKSFNELILRADKKRAARANARPVEKVEYYPRTGKWRGVCYGSKAGVEWHPTITVGEGGRSFFCDCPDHLRNARSRGPCKHVISLALTLRKT